MSNATFAPVRDRFRIIAGTIVPEAETLDEAGWAELESIVEQGLASRPSSVRRQLRLFVRALDLLPLLRFGRTFRALDHQRRTRFLLAEGTCWGSELLSSGESEASPASGA